MRRSNLAILVLFFSIQLTKADYYAPAQNAKTHLWGYINQNGKKLTKFKYRLAFNFSYGKAIVLRDKWYYLDKENLAEHVFDDTLQKYFSAVIMGKLKSDKLKFYNDSDWVISNLLTPAYLRLDFGYYGGSDYLLFHFSTPNKILMANFYLGGNKKYFYQDKYYSLYDINTGFISKFDRIWGVSGGFINNRFLGLDRGGDTSNRYNWGKFQIAVYDTAANIIYNLDTIKENMIPQLRTLFRSEIKYWDPYDTSITFNNLQYRELSPECINIEFSVIYSKPDLYGIDTSFILYIPEKKIYPVKPFLNMSDVEKNGVIDLCKCQGTIFNTRINNDTVRYVYGSDTLTINDSISKIMEKSQSYGGYYLAEYLKNPKKAIRLYVYAISYKEKKFLWGVWDGKKDIIKPKYQLLGVFN